MKIYYIIKYLKKIKYFLTRILVRYDKKYLYKQKIIL
jgi:hypothetical protein